MNPRILILIIILIHIGELKIFAQKSNFKATKNTYAVIIGISQYENPKIPKLEFSHIDAQLFAEFLKSEKGGSLSDENIMLLTNEQADIASIYNALDWLKYQVKENDQAYIYFSGHGDVETTNDKKLGYLLAHNSPPNNYPNNAISLKDINEIANFISLDKKAKMVLILDACHSGVLAGDYFKGKQFVNKQLQVVLNNEVRLTACAANEEAAEGINWGGGRGAFSYYLLKGLNGFAEKNNDEKINLQEIKGFLDSCFVNDQFLISQKHSQKPVIEGHPAFPLAHGQNNSFTTFRGNFLDKPIAKGKPRGLAGFSKVSIQPIDEFFAWLDSIEIEEKVDFEKFESLSELDFPQEFLTNVELFKGISFVSKLKTQLVNNTALQRRFNEKFAVYVHKRGQEIINNYLSGKQEELDKRFYYNLNKKEYLKFLRMLKIAQKILPEEHHLAHYLNLNYNYLSGLLARIHMSSSINSDSLLVEAFKFQNIALGLDSYTAYINNELGVLYLYNKDYKAAEEKFILATEIAPTWAIPWHNLSSVFFSKEENIRGKYNLIKAKHALKKVEELQPDLARKEINMGKYMELQSNFLAAESYFLQAIKRDFFHFLPFERLGFVYLSQADFKNAETYFYESDQRKKGLSNPRFEYSDILPFSADREIKYVLPDCEDLELRLKLESPNFLPFLYGLRASFSETINDSVAIQQLTIGIKNQPKMPLAKHFLGKALYRSGKWEQSLPLILEAKKDFKSVDELEIELRSLLKLVENNTSDECLLSFFKFFQYEPLEDDYIIASLYEKLNQAQKVIENYESIIANENLKHRIETTLLEYQYIDKVPAFGAIKLSNFYEKLENYELAESTLSQQIEINSILSNDTLSSLNKKFRDFSFCDISWTDKPISGYRLIPIVELIRFYERMIEIFPQDYTWKEKAGLLIYKFYKDYFTISFEEFVNRIYRWDKNTKFQIRNSVFLYTEKPYLWEFGLECELKIPGTDEKISFKRTENASKNAYNYLKRSIDQNGEVFAKTEVLQALAELAPWVDRLDESAVFHNQVIQQDSLNLKSRYELIKIYNFTMKFHEALAQLKILHTQKKSTTDQKLQLAQYLIRSNEIKEAIYIMNRLDSLDIPSLTRNYQLFYNIVGNQKEAEILLKEGLIKMYPRVIDAEKKYQTILQISENLYVKARQLALKKQNKAALLWLKNSIDKGFKFPLVLKYDPAWEKLRDTKQWMDLVNFK